MPIYTTTSLGYNNTSTMLTEYFLNSTFTITDEDSTFTITDENENERVVFRGQIKLYQVNTDDKDIDDTTSEELDRFLSGFRIKKQEKKSNA